MHTYTLKHTHPVGTVKPCLAAQQPASDILQFFGGSLCRLLQILRLLFHTLYLQTQRRHAAAVAAV